MIRTLQRYYAVTPQLNRSSSCSSTAEQTVSLKPTDCPTHSRAHPRRQASLVPFPKRGPASQVSPGLRPSEPAGTGCVLHGAVPASPHRGRPCWPCLQVATITMDQATKFSSLKEGWEQGQAQSGCCQQMASGTAARANSWPASA